jgi:hypothetical protein
LINKYTLSIIKFDIINDVEYKKATLRSLF